MFLHCLDNLFRYSVIKSPPLKKVNFSTSNYCFSLVALVEDGHLFQENKATDV